MTNLKNKLATRANTGAATGNTFQSLLIRMRPQIEAALPKHVSPERITRIAMTAYSSNPKLRECNAMSILASVMISSQLGLEVNTPLGQAYIIPFRNGKTKQMEAQFQIGYRGLLDLAYRTGEYQVIYAMEVYENDEFEFAHGLEPHLTHKPSMKPKGDPIYYYAVYRTKNGGADFRVWGRAAIIAHSQKYSQAVKRGWASPWKTDFDAMAKKTVLKDLLKYAPMSIELQNQLTNDEVVKREIAEDMNEVQGDYIDVDISNDFDEPDEEPVKELTDASKKPKKEE